MGFFATKERKREMVKERKGHVAAMKKGKHTHGGAPCGGAHKRIAEKF